jgi:hypothetical protein
MKGFMKKLICILVLIIGTIACKKESIEEMDSTPSTPTTPSTTISIAVAEQTLLLEGMLTKGVHTTTGTVRVYEDKEKKHSLVFENFKTDAGPDLRIYIAEDQVLTDFTQITDKVTTNGSFILPIPPNVDLKKQRTVVIWCKSFSVLFGSAILK